MNYTSDLYSTLGENPQDALIDVEELEDTISELVLVNSMINIVNSLGYREFSEELVAVLKEYVGRLLEALAVEGTYVPGLASFLSSSIEKYLWELDFSDASLAEFLSILVGYRASLLEGRVSDEDSRELLHLTCHHLHISSCEELERRLRPLTPHLALQVALTSLALLVGGLGVE